MKHEFFTRGTFQRRAENLAALAFLLACFWLNTACAKEVYTWTDKDGVTHFSDTPPESGNAQQVEVDEAYYPGSSGAYTEDEPTVADPSGEDDNPMTENPQTLAQQRREQLAEDRQERREAKAEAEASCEQNRQLLARLEPARRVYFTNEEGEQVRMDDEQRVDMVEEAKDFIAKNCR